MEVSNLTSIGSQRVAPKHITDSRYQIFPTTLCFSVRSEGLGIAWYRALGTDLGAQGLIVLVDTRPLYSLKKYRYVCDNNNCELRAMTTFMPPRSNTPCS